MQKTLTLLIICIFLTMALFLQLKEQESKVPEVSKESNVKTHWFILHRKSNQEFLYFGEPGNRINSVLVKVFKVKSGIPNKRPTPLPKLLGRKYWLVTGKYETFDNPETAPYFLALNIPVTEEMPFGPEPYLECNGQCNWELPGAFGLHGINGDSEKIAQTNPGSSGCIRHSDEDITYLYNLVDYEKSEIRYYIEDV